ncbi:MAG: potassium transporter TrkG [bacterium]
MRFRIILAVLARINLFVGLAMVFPLLFAWQDHMRNFEDLFFAMMTTLVICALFSSLFKVPKSDLTHREGMMIVTLGWLSAGFFGALPYLFAKVFGPIDIHSFINAYFESVSGFTTTGASVLGTSVAIEDLSHGILFWRSLTHWLGGMGIIVLAVAILPFLGVGGNQLFHAEAPGPTKEKLKPRIRETATTLWLVYILLSALETVLLMIAGMDFFDALCHMFGTMATGGFSTRNASVAAYNSGFIDVIIIVFMFLAGANFSLHYLAFTGRIKSYVKNSEFKYYFIIMISGALIVSLWLFFSGSYNSIAQALRFGTFQTVSIITTTGYATADFELWPIVIQLFLFVFMFIGGCAGSTGGAIKIVRLVLLFKYAYRELFKLIHPKAFAAIKFGGRVVHKDILESVAGFFILYIGIFIFGALFMSSLGIDIITSLSSVAATLGNIGPGLGTVGPAENYYHIPTIGKAFLTACMILGRLEIYTVLVLLIPTYWKK